MDKRIFVAQLEKAFSSMGLSGRGRNAQIAEIMEVTLAAVGKWFNVEDKSLPSTDRLLRISDLTGMSVSALLRGEEYNEVICQKLPVLSAQQAININQLTPSEKYKKYIVSQINIPNGFAVKIDDDSMMGSHQSYPIGCLAVFEYHTTPPVSGQLVYAKIAGKTAKQGVFRKYIETATQRYLMPLNPTYESDTEFKIIGIYHYAILDLS